MNFFLLKNSWVVILRDCDIWGSYLQNLLGLDGRRVLHGAYHATDGIPFVQEGQEVVLAEHPASFLKFFFQLFSELRQHSIICRDAPATRIGTRQTHLRHPTYYYILPQSSAEYEQCTLSDRSNQHQRLRLEHLS